LGSIFYQTHEFEKSIAAYRKYLATLRAGHPHTSVVRNRIAQAERMLSAENNVVATPTIAPPVSIPRSTEADRLFNNRQFVEAGEIYEELVRENPQNELFNYRLARCLYEMGNLDAAYTYFRRSGTRFPLTNFFLGNIYFRNYEFDKAVAVYRTYLATLRAGHPRIPDVQNRIARAEQAARMLLRVEDIAIIDSLVVDRADFLSRVSNERFQHEVGVLTQERIRVNEHRTEDKITFVASESDKMIFSDLHNEKMNLFISHRLLNDWSAPIRLPETINSATANQNYPFLMSDGVTMFFASDGENSIGGYDIFITRQMPATNSYLPPENMGMPFNSPYNDFMLVIDEVNNIGWFASDRYQPDDKVIIYFFIPNEIKIFVQSNDEAEIRSRARLKTFRQAALPANDARLGIIRAMQPDNIQTDFTPVLINNATQTVQEQQFQEQNGTRLNRRETERLAQQTERMKAELNRLWQKYVDTENASERANVVTQIRALEREIQRNQQLIQQQRYLTEYFISNSR
jgi:tetratricopeptide (TPR) repeat protein